MPDVFTVSVGNLPSGANVLIKITFVAELEMEGESVLFNLPGSVAPWHTGTALDPLLQSEVGTVKIKQQHAGKTTLQVRRFGISCSRVGFKYIFLDRIRISYILKLKDLFVCLSELIEVVEI